MPLDLDHRQHKSNKWLPCAWCEKDTVYEIEIQPYRYSPCCMQCAERIINRKPVELYVRGTWERESA